MQARYQYRHPQETLEFFGIKPGMTLVEGLPGRGWYTKILLPYLGPDGHLIGANYAMDMWPNFPFADEEFMKKQSTWVADWPAGAEEWRGDSGASIAAFNFGSMPDDMKGTADVVFFARVLHNLARYESKGGFLHGYLKKGFVIAAAKAAGFEFVAESDINANPADQPTAELEAIGESNRMTLKFRKPE